MRLRDIATTLGSTERSAFSIVNDLVKADYVVKHKDGNRNRYPGSSPRTLARSDWPGTDDRTGAGALG
jgi:hypothetical protein